MDIAALTLFGRARYQVLEALFSLRAGAGLHLREIARRTGLSPTAVQYELRLLGDAGLAVRDDSSGRNLYRIDFAHAIAKDLQAIVRKTSAAAPGTLPDSADVARWAGKRRQQERDYKAKQLGRKSMFLADAALIRKYKVDLTPGT